MREADRTERLAMFELYGTLCGDGGVAWLDELLNPKGGLFSKKEDPEVRACAAIALGRDRHGAVVGCTAEGARRRRDSSCATR